AGPEGLGRVVVLGDVAGVVVVDLVVVPGDNPREGGVGRLQVGVGAVLGEALPVAVERGRLGPDVTADVAAGRLVDAGAGLVDVVTEVHDEVEVLFGHV